uniref:Protein kinase domain-containing protein n=1 Tax=Knipowitschia caucasica TaxID=637954 RepID=A0AAV2JW35_KNICA
MDSEKVPKATLQEIIPKDFEVLKVLGEGVYGKVLKCVKRGTKMEVAIKIPHNKAQRLKEEMATALGVMCDYGIIHTDIKTDNIMVSDHTSQQLQFKLIDFGLAMYLDSVKPGTTVACLPLRAPEVILGLRFNAAVDMWSLGVTVVELMLKKPLFTPSCEFEALKAIVKVLGSLPQRMLNKSQDTPKYFLVDVNGWRLRKTEDYEKRFGLHKYQIKNSYSEKFSSLRQLLKKDYKMQNPLQTEELDSCIDLLKKMVDVDDVTRITPGQIHLHPFISTCWKKAPESCCSSLEAENKPERKQQSSDSDSDYESESFVSLDIQMLLPREFFLITCLGEGNFGQIVLCNKMDTKQLASTALKALKFMQIIVTDLTLDTIWLRTRDPIKVKLIDFSSSIHTTAAKKGRILQKHVNCRAPEVILGLPLSEAIDVWSLANVTATMLLGYSIFPEQSEFETVRHFRTMF